MTMVNVVTLILAIVIIVLYKRKLKMLYPGVAKCVFSAATAKSQLATS